MQALSIKTLGDMRLERDAEAIHLPTRKARALLVYLALSPAGSRSREHLADILWGRSAEAQARASLRQTLSSLRKVFSDQPGLISAQGETVVIRQDQIEIDAVDFTRLANSTDTADLERAADLYQGEFLQGFSLREEGFEEWLYFSRQQYREIAIQVVSRLIDHYSMLREFESGVRYAQQLVALDSIQELSHYRLIELYARLGRREHALRQFVECESILAAELNLSPGPEITALYESIKTGTQADPAAAPSVPGCRAGNTSPQPRKPSIAVLPFDNLSGDPSQQYLADAITEDLVSNLAHDLWFDVIAHTSTDRFRDNKPTIADISAELGARYLVDGSLRKDDNRVRVSVVLIDGLDARQIWSQQYDRVATDIFELQDQIAISIAAAVIPELGVVEQRSAMRKHPQNLDAWSCCHKAFWHLYTFELDELALAQELFERAIEHDNSYSQPYAGLAYGQMMYVWYDSSKKSLLDTAEQNARHAVMLNNRDSFAHFALGRILSMLKRFDEAIYELETAIELNPSFGRAYFGLASVLAYSAQYAEALEPIDTAIRLSPADPHLWTFYNIKSRTLIGLGRYEEAEHWARQAVRQPSSTFWSDVALVSALGYLGKRDEARLAIRELQRKRPGYSCEQYDRDDFVLVPTAHQVVVEGMLKAGLAEFDSEVTDSH